MVLEEVVEPRGAGLVVLEVHRALRAGDRLEPVLREDEGGADVTDVRVAQRDHQHGRVRVAGALAVLGVEAGVARHLERLALDGVDERALLGVGGHGGRDAAEGAVELFAEGGETRTRAEHDDGDQTDGDGCDGSSDDPGGGLHGSPGSGVVGRFNRPDVY